jgi:hypothetical protein
VAVAAARRALDEVPAARDLRRILRARVAQRQAEEHYGNTKRNCASSDYAIHVSLPNSGDRCSESFQKRGDGETLTTD